MELERQTEEPVQKTKPQNPAKKWLIVSACGIALSLGSLGIHALRGGSNPDPLPKVVLSQIFGFTPYYFVKDTAPDHLRLQAGSPKFFGNAFSFKLVDPKKEVITVSQKTLPTPTPKAEGESMTSSLGTAIIKNSGGHISAVLVSSDKTYITLSASDFITPGTLIDVYNSLTPIVK